MSEVLDAATIQKKLADRTQELDELLGGGTRRVYEGKLEEARREVEEEKAKRAESRRQLASQLEPLTDKHPFRRALLFDPAAVEFVRGDLEWSRLVLLLYGGLADAPFAAYVTQYAEIADVLQMDDAKREAFLLQLRRKPYWRQSWEGEDVVYNLAVYLDTECGAGSRAAKHCSLSFDPLFLCLDSVLTPFLLHRLEARVPGKALLDPLLEIARCRDDSLRCASAMLALLAIDPSGAFDDLLELSRDASRRDVVRVFRNLLAQRLGLLQDGVVLYCAASKFTSEFDHLVATLPPDKQEGIVSVFYRAFCEGLPGPPPLPHLETGMDLPYVNAEIWGTWMSGHGEDAVYNFAVVLDTIGKRIHSADGVANLHRAHTTRFQQYTTWSLDPIPPVWDSPADLYGEALTIAQESTSSVMQDLFHVGIIIYAGIRLSETPDLQTDALAAALFLPDKSFADVMPYLDAKLAENNHYAIEREVIGRVMRIADPVIHARALWRVARYLLHWGEVNLFDAAILAAAKLPPGLQRARAYERLTEDAPLAMRGPLLQQLQQAVRAIPDANNRVRALCRLALLSTGDESAPLIREAVGQLGSIPGDDERAETLVLMRKVLSENQVPVDGLDDVAETETDPWYRHKAMGLLSFELAKLQPALLHAEDATPVVLHAVLTDVMHLLDRNQELNDSWLQLAKRDGRDAAFAALLADIARSDNGTLPFNKTAYASLSALAADGGAGLAAELLPHLAVPRMREVPELSHWLLDPPHECFRPYASLMLAESGRLDAATLPQILDLLRNGKDIARYRAALVLHSDNVYIGKPDPRHRASALGLDGILRISEFAIRMRDLGRLGPANTARWTWMNVVFDSPQIFEDLVRCIHQDPQRRQAAAAVLSSLYILTDASQEKFVQLLLENRSGLAAEALLEGYCTLHHKALKFSVPERHATAVDEYWQSLPPPLVESVRGIPERIDSVEKVLLALGDDPNGLNQPAALDAALRDLSLTAPRIGPPDLAQCAVYDLSKDTPKALASAQKIVESAGRLRALFGWLRTSLAESIDDPTRFYRKRDTLLEIAGHCGQHSPAAVFNLVEELDLQDLLVKAAVHHSSFNGRAGAVTLLGYLRNPGRGFLTALKSALTDTAEVQQAALAMVRRLRHVSPLIASDLCALLEGDDATLAYAASRLLSAIARHEKTGNADRKSILRALSSALKSRTARHAVCAFEHAGGRMWISKLGTLAQRHYQSLLEIVSIS